MCVAVQKMVKPRSARVAFTLNPGNGDRSAVAIDSAWGFGEGVVSGDITPDNFLVDKVMSVITQRTVSAKQHAYRLGDDDQVRRVELAPGQATAPSLTDAEILAVARLARAAEKHYGCPQDVEWALDGELPDGGTLSCCRLARRRCGARRRSRSRPAWIRWPASLRRWPGPCTPASPEYPSRPGEAGHDRSTNPTEDDMADRFPSPFEDHHPARAPRDGEVVPLLLLFQR